MKIQEKSLDEIKRILQKEKEFAEINSWKFKHIPLGEMEHTYEISKGKKIYFLKELKLHEAQMEYFLCRLKLSHLPFSIYPGLLRQKILVRKFIKGRMLRSKNIDLNLIKEFAIMRNRLNEKRFFNEYNILKVKNFSQKDDGFCEEGIRKSFSQAQKILKKLNKYKLQEIDDFLEILKELGKNKGGIINDYISMPFAKQHQDFREDNIITDAKGTQKLID
ncbi:hypothetical protein HN604_00375 [archaeon]|nr:hypothetical protein [archaeon]MBT6182829.1 hypothetical protein [archaeon]MBT6606789.1 hypothetical protein [archaeon]MBT7660521.1 hypothetical protein [archaeon]